MQNFYVLSRRHTAALAIAFAFAALVFSVFYIKTAHAASIGTYDQCSNDKGTGYTAGDTGCRWINGNINGNNSAYQEGDSTVQRIWLNGFLPGSTHTITFQYGTTKQGKHAYDYLTTWDQSEAWIFDVDRCQDIIGCDSALDATYPIPHDGNDSGHFETGVRNFVIRGGTIASTSLPSLSGVYTGDSETIITVNFTVANSGTLCTGAGQNMTCGVVIWFGAHIANTSEWQPYNSTAGATSIPGSPYHVALAVLDGGSVGNRDNQMQASAIIVPSTITIHKVTSPNVSDSTVFSFNTTGLGYSNFTLSGGNNNAQSVAPATYSVTEGTLSGWSLTNLQCSATGTGTSATPNQANGTVSITIGAGGGGVVDCTFTNTLQQGTLQIVKRVINDNGGTAGVSAFGINSTAGTLNFDAGVTDGANTLKYTSQAVAVNAGSYTIRENDIAGYSEGTWSCTGATPSNTSISAGAVTVPSGVNVVCTITNNDIPAHLIVIKHVINDNGGTATASSFTTTISNVTTATPSAPGAEAPGVDNTLASVGAYSVDEGDHVGYAKTLSQDCTGTIAIGETKTCTITNDDIAPTLTLVKTVENNFGGNAVANDFQGKIDGNSVAWNVVTNVTAGAHTASETNLTGYTAGSWGGDCATDGSVALALGENKTCTITNTDQPAHIILNKEVINDNGGTAGINDFGLTVGGNAVTSGSNTQVNSNTVIALNEAGLAGYDFVSLTGDAQCPAVLGGTVTLNEGETVTCTITNNDKAPKLHLRKVVVNDNGGNATEADFTLTANGAGDNDITGTSPVDSGATLMADTFALSENSVAGYSASDWVCVGGTQNGASITLGIDQEATCTITNDDISPTLTLIKHVVNDNGGTKAVADFVLKIDSTVVTSGASNNVNAGAHTASEISLPGYSASDWSGDCSANGNVSLALGENKTCEITNNDIAPKLHLRKVVVNDNGGNANEADFTLTANGTGDNDITGTSPVDSGAGLLADTFALSENSVAGYSASDWVCVGGTQNGASITLGIDQEATCTITNNDIAPKLTLVKTVVNDNGGQKQVSDFPLFISGTPATSGTAYDQTANLELTASETNLTGYAPSVWGGDCNAQGKITLLPGDDKTCTITNDDIAPKLTLVKVVVNNNGGSKVVSDFPLFINGNGVTSGVKNTLSANVLYTATETGDSGYTASAWTGDCSEAGTITLQPGDDKTCTITNNDKQGKLIVHKVTNPTDTQTQFGITASGSGAIVETPTQSIVGGGTVEYTVDAGTYSVSEASKAGWDETSNTCSEVVVPNGGQGECTITNTQRGHLIVQKTTNPSQDSTEFTINATGSGNITDGGVGTVTDATDKDYEVTPGTYSVAETVPAGWDKTGDTCQNVTVAAGETKYCLLTNTKRGSLEVTKVVVFGNLVNSGSVTETFSITITGTSYPSGDTKTISQAGGLLTWNNLLPGDYIVTEADAGAEWTETVPAGVVTVPAGGKGEATVTNTYVPGSLDVTKALVTTGYKFPDNINTSFTINVSGPSYPLPAGTDLVFNVVNGVVTPATQSLTNLIPGTYSVTEPTPGVMWNVSGTGNIEVTSGVTANKTVTNTIKLPSTTITLTPDVLETTPGGNVTLTITDTNNGAVPITSPSVDLYANNALVNPAPTYVSGDTNNNTVMDVDETWTWTWTGVINVETVFTVNGIGTDPLGNPVNGPTYASETTSKTIKVIGATRTIGFWQTHTTFTSYVFSLPTMQQYVGSGIHKGVITNTTTPLSSQLFGGFYAPIAKTTNGTKRSPVDQARIQMLQQLLAAKLNCAAFGCSQAIMTLISDSDAAYAAGNNKNLIISLAGQLDTYNNSGDNIAIDPSLPVTGKATPKTSQSFANISFWNNP